MQFMDTNELIARARRSLPAAFKETRAQVPDESRVFIPPGAMDNATPFPADLDLELPQSLEGTPESEREELADAYASFHELGFEAFAFYHSFHQAAPDQKWGIFYYQKGIRRLALMLMREWEAQPTKSTRTIPLSRRLQHTL
jgi:hypothetical protein